MGSSKRGGEPEETRSLLCRRRDVFDDEFALTREDADAHGEQRFVTLGMDATGELLVVVYTCRGANAIRLISAWKADRSQRKQYEARRR
jgi:uncharacterized DUF497 family protein